MPRPRRAQRPRPRTCPYCTQPYERVRPLITEDGVYTAYVHAGSYCGPAEAPEGLDVRSFPDCLIDYGR